MTAVHVTTQIQGKLFGDPIGPGDPAPSMTPFQPKQTTSLLGAKQAATNAGTQMTRYLGKLHSAGARGLTDHEAVKVTELPLNVINARRGSAHGKQYVVDSGRRRRGPTGVPNVVWIHRLHTQEQRDGDD